MRAWTGWALGCAMACAPAASVAQGVAVAPALEPRAAATVDSLLRAGTGMLLTQVEALTAPGRDASGDAMERPCWGGEQSGELTFAGSDRPLGIAARAIWEIRANHFIRSTETPHSICFPRGMSQPTRAFGNVIRFNSRLLSTRRMRGQVYLLHAFRSREEERQAGLGYERVVSVCTATSDGPQHRLFANGRSPVSSDVMNERRVHYRLQTGAPAASGERARCRRVEIP
jgi:hypothetical protein